MNLLEIESKLVTDSMFDDSRTRSTIYNNFVEFMTFIYEQNFEDAITKIWIDGSFTTDEINPQDMDIIIYYDQNSSRKKELENYIDLNKHKIRVNQLIHICCITDFSNIENHDDVVTRVQFDRALNRSITSKFKFDRKNNKKGYVHINVKNQKVVV